jgi:23S rRNA pseudouridine2604 synthase
MAEPVRLAKRVAALAGCSRRDAELYIEAGWVRVDGHVVAEPQSRFADDQRVELDASATLRALEPVTLLLHRPVGLDDEAARGLLAAEHRAADDAAASRPVPARLASLTQLLPLPAFASGLAVYSQQRGVIRHLVEDASVIEQEIVVSVEGQLPAQGLARLGHGLAFEGRALPPIKVSWQSEQRLRFALKGIAPDLVPWMCEQVGLRMLGAKRLRIGRIPLAGLPPGQWRSLRHNERF